MSDQTTQQEMVLPEACPQCGKPIRFLWRVTASPVMVGEKMLVYPNPEYRPHTDEFDDEDNHRYVAAYVPDIPADFDEPRFGYTFACAECRHTLPGVDSSFFAFWNVKSLTPEDRFDLMCVMEANWGDDGAPPEDADLVALYDRLAQMNRIASGIAPGAESPAWPRPAYELTTDDHSDIIEWLGYHLTENDRSLTTPERIELKLLQGKLIAQNQVAMGIDPEPLLVRAVLQYLDSGVEGECLYDPSARKITEVCGDDDGTYEDAAWELTLPDGTKLTEADGVTLEI